MIKLIGLKRILTLFILVLFNVALALTFFLWMEPERQKSEVELRGLNSQIAKLRNDILNIKEEIKRTEQNMPYYEAMDRLGFFSGQDRFMADELIKQLGDNSGLKTVRFTIDPLTDIKNDSAEEANRRLVSSTINLGEMRGFTDVDIYQFLYTMNNGFPGHIRLKSLEITKAGEVTSTALDKIKDGSALANNGFVTATAKLQWLTMIETEQETIPGVGR